jgi:hypothetical protein
MKILITEEQQKIINEYIDPSEAHNEVDSVKTLCDEKRGVAFLAGMNITTFRIVAQMICDCKLRHINVPSNPHIAFIVYRKGYEKQAQELLNIAEKYGGYLDAMATEEDSRKIGELLEYDPKEVEGFIKRMNIRKQQYGRT